MLPAEELAKLATVDVKPAELVEPSKLADAHPFLHYYGMLTHQMNMLQVRAHSAPCACWACHASVSQERVSRMPRARTPCGRTRTGMP